MVSVRESAECATQKQQTHTQENTTTTRILQSIQECHVKRTAIRSV